MKKNKPKTEKKNQMFSTVCYVAISVGICFAAIVVIPKIMSYISGFLYKKSVKSLNKKRDENDWGPVMEKKH